VTTVKGVADPKIDLGATGNPGKKDLDIAAIGIIRRADDKRGVEVLSVAYYSAWRYKLGPRQPYMKMKETRIWQETN
jgi:hypothetical protein